jgi:hypothetical protein
MRATLVRWQGAWLAVCVLGWLLLSLGGGKSQAECGADGDFLCFSEVELLWILGIYGLFIWMVGAVTIALVWAFGRWVQRRWGR